MGTFSLWQRANLTDRPDSAKSGHLKPFHVQTTVTSFSRAHMQRFQLGTYFTGCLNIQPTLSFEATAAVLGEALGVKFLPDQDGKYEEFPAYRAFALGLELALLAPPLPEFDTRESPENCFQLAIDSGAHVTDVGANVDLNALIEAQLLAKTKLKIERIAPPLTG